MKNQSFSRRKFLAGSAGVAASLALPQFVIGQSKPNSNFNGVQIGTITYSFRSMPSTAEDILGYLKTCGLSSVELMGEPAEEYAGIPNIGRGGRGRNLTDEQREEIKKQQEQVLNWRTTTPMDKYAELKKLYNDAGVDIHVVKFGNIGNDNMPDEEIEYYFKVAKALGAKGITRELSEDAAKRLGKFADQYEVMIGFHNHTQITPTTYDGDILSYGNYLGINFDVGHYLAGTNESPIPFMQKHHDKILSLHLKDRKKDNGDNLSWGEGETPLKEILNLMRKEGWTFPGNVELEYQIPEGSDAVKEVTKCVQYCKNALA
jgi:sugar phosphate isomerase/epimerase